MDVLIFFAVIVDCIIGILSYNEIKKPEIKVEHKNKMYHSKHRQVINRWRGYTPVKRGDGK